MIEVKLTFANETELLAFFQRDAVSVMAAIAQPESTQAQIERFLQSQQAQATKERKPRKTKGEAVASSDSVADVAAEATVVVGVDTAAGEDTTVIVTVTPGEPDDTLEVVSVE